VDEWKNRLNAFPIDWLLEEGNPSVRFLTLTRLLDESPTGKEARRAQKAIMEEGLVPRLIEKQVDGSWNEPGMFYRDKYRGTVWQLIILAEHEASGKDKAVAAACEHILRFSQDRDGFGFSVDKAKGDTGGRHSEVIPCLTGNMVWSLIKLGFLGDERVRKAVDWIARYQRFDDGDSAPQEEWPYDRYEMCWGRHSCHMGVVKALKALSAIPETKRSARVSSTIADGCEYILKHRVHRRSHDPTKTAKPGWLKLQFPLMYQTDILEIVGILLDLGVRDERMTDAMEAILAKQDSKGRWPLEATFNGRFHLSIEAKGNPSKWITLRALSAIKGYYS
jgi:hypothetical protein